MPPVCCCYGFQISIELLKTILVWPLAAILLGWMFKPYIAKLLERPLKWRPPGGGEFEVGIPQPPVPPPTSISGDDAPLNVESKTATEQTGEGKGQASGAAAGDVTPYGYALMANLGTSAMTEEMVKVLEKDLEAVGTSAAFRERLLLRAVAKSQMRAEFERVLALIYKSQLLALAFLAATEPQSHPVETIQKYYEDAKKQWSDLYKGISFDQWFRFLEISVLLTKDPSNNFRFEITVRGREFMNWVVNERREIAENKIF